MKVLKKKNLFLILMSVFCIIPMLCFAQTFEEKGKPLQGKWSFKNVSAIDENGKKISYNLENLECCEIPVAMEIQQDEIVFVYKASTEKVEYDAVVKGNFFCFPICAEWNIRNHQLQLRWSQDVDAQEPNVITVILTYK